VSAPAHLRNARLGGRPAPDQAEREARRIETLVIAVCLALSVAGVVSIVYALGWRP